MEQVVQLAADRKAHLVMTATQAARTLDLLLDHRRAAHRRKPSGAGQNAIHLTAQRYLRQLHTMSAAVRSSSEDLRKQRASLRTTLFALREIVAGALSLTDLSDRAREAVLAEISTTLVLQEYPFVARDLADEDCLTP
jgi:hypothetical protein